MLNVMDIDGALDIQETEVNGDSGLEIYTDYKDWVKVRDEINKLGYVVKEAGIIKEAKTFKTLEGKELEKAREALERIEDNDDVQEVWSNLKEI
jgi:transcriptional/translational regulatory protein YebC/TACO1